MALTLVPVMVSVGVCTDPVMVSVGVGTDPVMVSVGVGTEPVMVSVGAVLTQSWSVWVIALVKECL